MVVGLGEGTGEGVMLAVMVTLGIGVGETGAGAQLPANKARIKNETRFDIAALSFHQDHSILLYPTITAGISFHPLFSKIRLFSSNL